MKASICSLCLAVIAPVLLGASEEPSNSFRIVGEYIGSEAELGEGQNAPASASPVNLDLSTAEIRITYESSLDNGETENRGIGFRSICRWKSRIRGKD